MSYRFTLPVKWRPALLLNLVISVAAFHTAVTPAYSSATTQPAAQYPVFGVSFTPPVGWTEVPREQPTQIARWALLDEKGGSLVALLMVEGGRPTAGTAEATAQALAKNWGGKVAEAPTTLDGVPAFRVSAPPKGAGLSPREAIVVVRGLDLTLVMVGTVGNAAGEDALEKVRSNWRWVDRSRPSAEASARFVTARIGNAATMLMPAAMHLYPAREPKRVLDLGLYNPTRNLSEFLAYAQIAPRVAGESLDDVAKRLGDGMTKVCEFEQPMTFRQAKGEPRRLVSQTCRAKRMPPPGEIPANMSADVIWGLVELDQNRIVMVNFTLFTDVQADRDAYSAIALRMIESIAPTPAER